MTQQKADILYYGNLRAMIFNDILDSYFKVYPERKFKTAFLISSLWRGYFAEFEIINQELSIRSLKRYIGFDDLKKEFLEEDITTKSFPGSRKLEFFSGFIRISNHIEEQEKNLYSLLKIENGNLKEEMQISAEEFTRLNESGARIF